MRPSLRRTIIGAVVGAGIAAAVILPVLAAPAPPVGAHRHFIITASGQKVYVGPNFCEIPTTETGFAQFHANVHRGNPALKAFENPNNPVRLGAEGCPQP